MDKIVEELLGGSRRALARLLTYVENDQAQEELAQLYPHTGKAWVIGVTGAPGSGKSSLVNTMAKAYRAQDKQVAIIAVDPTSPFSGGAILGDRIRMRDLSGDTGIFIRSMATRGNLGGLSIHTRDFVRVMDAAGFDYILVETVGAGQSEVDIVRTANTTLVVEAPGMGDDIQAIKAGILEIADILVVNKADRAGANQTLRALRAMLELGHPASKEQLISHHGQLMPVTQSSQATLSPLWLPPVIQTVATEAKGIEELLEAIETHRHHTQNTGVDSTLASRTIEIELYERLREALFVQWQARADASRLQDLIERVRMRELDPQSAVAQLIKLNHRQ